MLRFEDCIAIGSVSKTHGHNGFVKLYYQFETIVLDIKLPVFLLIEGKPVPFFISETKGDEYQPLLKFEKVNSIEDAEKLLGFEVFAFVKQEKFVALPNLRHFKVYNTANFFIGLVEDVVKAGFKDLMLVISDDGKEILIPFETHFIVDLSTTNKSIIMDLPEGLIDLNE